MSGLESPEINRSRIRDVAEVLQIGGKRPSDAFFLAVVGDIAMAPDRTPLAACPHGARYDSRDPIAIDATTRQIMCPSCWPAHRISQAKPSTQRFLTQDVWCDVCGADIGRPVEEGGGTSMQERSLDRFLMRVWYCLACEPLLKVADPALEPRPARNAPCSCGSGRKFKHCHGA